MSSAPPQLSPYPTRTAGIVKHRAIFGHDPVEYRMPGKGALKIAKLTAGNEDQPAAAFL